MVSFDTNILVYATLSAPLAKTHRARDLLLRGAGCGAGQRSVDAMLWGARYKRAGVRHLRTGTPTLSPLAARGVVTIPFVRATNRVYAINPPFAVLKFAVLPPRMMLVRGISHPAPPTVV
jgi:hypothetical protein